MNLYSLSPLLANLLVVAKVVYDLISLQTGAMSRTEMSETNALYDNLLFVAIIATLAAAFLQDKRIKIASIAVGLLAIVLILTNERTFTPEFNTSPVYIESDE